MHARKHTMTTNDRKRFSPEAYGVFPVVDAQQIEALRERMREKLAADEWEVVEDIVEH